MVRRKRITKKNSGVFSGLVKSKRGGWRISSGFKGSFLVLVLLIFLGGGVVGFYYLENYVQEEVGVVDRVGTLELVNPPAWINESLKEKIYSAARSGGEDLRLDLDSARSVQSNISEHVSWLESVRVQSTDESFRIYGRWRKPVALVKIGVEQFYLDADLVVLDYEPVPELPIVEVSGFSARRRVPLAGSLWQHADLAAAVELVVSFDRMDKLVADDKPLLKEIASIDVSNFDGRKRESGPHIILYAKDRTEIVWGAELGKWQRYLEAPDSEKLAKLYSHYKEYGSLMNNVKYIDLRAPEGEVYRPTDRY